MADCIKPKYQTIRAFQRIKKLLSEYKRVRVVFRDYNYSNVVQEFERTRVLTFDGDAQVKYRSTWTKKYGIYSKSCFLSSKKTQDMKGLLDAMFEHDLSVKIVPIEIHYGWFFLKKEKFKCSTK
jgi:hypothetical protein